MTMTYKGCRRQWHYLKAASIADSLPRTRGKEP